MNKHTDQLRDIGCRRAQKLFAAAGDERAGLERHLKGCEDCSLQYRIHSLTRTVLDYSGAREPITPGEDFFVSLRARLERGPQGAGGAQPAFDDSWAAALLLTARQLIPAMALLLLFIIGATLIGGGQPSAGDQAAARPSDRVLFNDIYDYPAPTADDVLETLVALEEKENGK
ncbi:MAG TPA: hypothetical protein VE262_22220 [Blastocatellia bacterium]|nr:hypothetical protein [Blastocatellia bacterium]